MRKVIYYETKDGTQFETEAEALAYEVNHPMVEKMQEIKNYCAERSCCNCIFNQEECCIFYNSNRPLDWRS